MSPLDRPQLRPYLSAVPGDRSGEFYVLHDRLRLSQAMLRVSPLELELIQLFDGRRSLREVQVEAVRATEMMIPLRFFIELARDLDEALFLEGARFRERASMPIRPPSCIGCYPEDPDELRQQFRELFSHPLASGLPGESRLDQSLRAVLAPHIDYARGGLTYTHAFKEVYERSNASLFVIVGTSHYSRQLFTLTRKHFSTPLGVVPTDSTYIDRIVAHYGEGLFDDELTHFPEHSIELEVVFLQYLYERKRDIRIVPLVVGSFGEFVQNQESPSECPDIMRMVEALKAAERETAEPICYIISGDLAHIGPKFDDPEAVHAQQLDHSRRQDHGIIRRAEKADSSSYFEMIRDERDERRICGLPPTWVVLEAAKPSRGRLLHYDQYVHPQGYESVSFASMVFER